MGPPKKTFRSQLRIAMNKEMGLKIPKSDKKVDKNLFLLLGYGVNSYFEVLREMMVMFAFISVALIPVFMIYNSNHQKELSHLPGMANMVSSLSMGNLGGAKTICH